MKQHYVLKTFGICVFAFLIVYAGFMTNTHLQKKASFKTNSKNSYHIKKTTYVKPTTKPDAHHYARVEISIRDDLKASDGKILEASFNNDMLTLQPTDSRGRRGSTFLQLKPGLYVISWTVKSNKYKWPRYTKHQKKINITSSDLWLYISIEGKNIKIS